MLMREVFARQLGGIRSDAMPGYILDRRRAGNNIKGLTVGTAWPVTLARIAGSEEPGFRHAVADPRAYPGRFREAFDLWLETADEDPRSRAARTGAAMPFTSVAPTWGTGFVGQTSQQPVTGVTIDAYGDANLPVYGDPGLMGPQCPGYDGNEGFCFSDNGTNWIVNWDPVAGDPVSTWTSSPLTTTNPVVFVQSVAAGLWLDSDGPITAPTLDSASACAQPPAPTLPTDDLTMWVSSYMSGSPEGTGCLSGNSGNVNLCYYPESNERNAPYCDSDTGSGQWGVGVRPVPAVLGYNMFLGFETQVTSSNGAPNLQFQANYPCNEDSVETLTTGSSHTQGFTIGGEMGYADGEPTATVNAGYEDEWETDSGSSYDIPGWAFQTTATGTAWSVPEGGSNYNSWGSFDGTTPPPQFGSSTYALTTNPADLNSLQCGQNAVAGQSYYIGATTGQGSVDVTTTFTYWAGTTSQVVDLMQWDQPSASTQFPTTLLQSVVGGDYPITFTLATDSRAINPVQIPTTFAGTWSDPKVVSAPDQTQVLQSTLTVTPAAGTAQYEYTASLLLAVGLENENQGALNGLVSLESVKVGGTAVSGGDVGVAITVSGGQPLEMTFNFTTISGVPYFATAYVTSSNPAESLSAAWAQVPITYQPVTSGGSRKRSLKDRLTRKRDRR